MKPELITGSITPGKRSTQKTKARVIGHLPPLAKVSNLGRMLDLWRPLTSQYEERRVDLILNKLSCGRAITLSPLEAKLLVRYAQDLRTDLSSMLAVMVFLEHLAKNALAALGAVLANPKDVSEATRWYEYITKDFGKE